MKNRSQECTGPDELGIEDRMTIDKVGIASAYLRLHGRVRKTPIIESGLDCFGLESSIELKLESLQHSGSFKVRGVFTHLLDPERAPLFRESGVVAASGGNHGAAVAFAAQKLGIRANIFVPEISSRAKVKRIESYGAQVHVGGSRYADALERSHEFQKSSGGLNVHAYDEEATLVGQGTVALEWQEQSPQLDTVLVAVGGGGLIGGMAAWYQGAVKLIACEPVKSCAYHRALENDAPLDVDVDGIAADSLGAKRIGSLMFPLAKKFVTSSVVVEDDAIVRAQAMLWNEMQVVAEAGGATALAALLSGAYRPKKGERVGVLICGGNTDVFPVAM